MKKINPILFIIAELILIIIITVLGIKIYQLKKKVIGTSIVKINKDYLQFNSQNHNLKYFYEPVPKSVEKWNPDWLGYEVENKINSDTLNEEKDYSITKDPLTYRIITIGDSFTFGQYVKTKDNFSKQLEERLNQSMKCQEKMKFEVINMGIDGYDIEYTVERFLKRGTKYKPDLVIWLLNEFNFDKINELLIPEMNKLKKLPDFIIKNGTLQYYRLRLAEKNAYKGLPADFFYSYQKKNLIRFKQNYQNQLLIISLSPYKKYNQLIDNLLYNEPNYQFFDSVVEQYWSNYEYRFADGHPNEKGHKIFAEKIFGLLKQYYLNNCNDRLHHTLN